MSNKQLQIIYSEKEILERIVSTFVEMLINRGILSKDSFKNSFKEVMDSGTDELVFKINTFPLVHNEKDIDKLKQSPGKLYVLKIVTHKLTAINKASGIADFLKEYTAANKIIVIKDIGQKVYNQLASQPNTEVFYEKQLIYNILNHDLQPEFFPISLDDPEETQKFYIDYLCNGAKLTKMDEDDPVARMLKLKVGQIVRVVRPSEVSAKTPSYRIVCKSTLNKS
jgi:DNA-directed RNA polymerase subunit H (RpoH/RPB5)